MLSPLKLYKYDKAVQRVAVTRGPRGKPAPSCSGSKCYNHYNVDWVTHRLVPTLADRGGEGRKKVLGHVGTLGMHTRTLRIGKHERVGDAPADIAAIRNDPVRSLQHTSPRWGKGVAPGRHERKPVPLAQKGTVEVSKKTKAATGAATGGLVGYGANKKLNRQFHSAINQSHKYRSKIKKNGYTEYKY